jgi:hypothetical protein
VNINLKLAVDLGSRLSDGACALDYRRQRIDPYVGICSEIVIDFTGVRSANSSFVNALIAGSVEQHGELALKVLVFKGCNPVIHVLVDAAIYLGQQKASVNETV